VKTTLRRASLDCFLRTDWLLHYIGMLGTIVVFLMIP